jgi:hypothetical protein
MSKPNQEKVSDPSEEPSAATTSAKDQKKHRPPRSDSRTFQKELLARLPTLQSSKWEAKETLNVYQDMQGIVNLDADAFLQPLAPNKEGPHE